MTTRTTRRGLHRGPTRALGAVLFAVGLGAGACSDQGTAPDHAHVVPPDGGICGHVDNAGGLTLVSHGDSLVSLFGFTFDGRYPNRLTTTVGGVVHGIEVTFLGPGKTPIRISNDCEINALEWEITDPTIAEGSQDAGVRWYLNVTGKRPGTTQMRIRLRHETHSHYTSEPIPIVVTAP